MSEEIALAIADLALTAQLRARVLEWKDAYARLAGAFDLHLDILECNHALADLAGVVYDVTLGAQADRADQLEQALAVAMHENDQHIALERRLSAELEAARKVVAAARRWLSHETSLLPIEKTDIEIVGGVLDAVRAYDEATKQPAAE